MKFAALEGKIITFMCAVNSNSDHYLAVVSENFMRISRLLRHVFGFGAYSRMPSPDI